MQPGPRKQHREAGSSDQLPLAAPSFRAWGLLENRVEEDQDTLKNNTTIGALIIRNRVWGYIIHNYNKALL